MLIDLSLPEVGTGFIRQIDPGINLSMQWTIDHVRSLQRERPISFQGSKYRGQQFPTTFLSWLIQYFLNTLFFVSSFEYIYDKSFSSDLEHALEEHFGSHGGAVLECMSWVCFRLNQMGRCAP